MAMVDKALAYARAHLQAVRICWIDQPPTVCDALEAVALCSDCYASGRIVGAVAQDKALEDILNKLLDDE